LEAEIARLSQALDQARNQLDQGAKQQEELLARIQSLQAEGEQPHSAALQQELQAALAEAKAERERRITAEQRSEYDRESLQAEVEELRQRQVVLQQVLENMGVHV
jgi:chromosome segregation ATPase